MDEVEVRKCIYCGEVGAGKKYGRMRSKVIKWICPNCGKQYTIKS